MKNLMISAPFGNLIVGTSIHESGNIACLLLRGPRKGTLHLYGPLTYGDRVVRGEKITTGDLEYG